MTQAMQISLPVDFGNCDEDFAVRLNTRGVADALQKNGIQLHEGQEITITDDELTAISITSLRDGIWVAKIIRWL